ncbi:choline-binding protein [Lactobacillus sp. ESL0681]|uniref:choline-binding protein n=1 Tax=Lactobacillus sp. ESL0681 TaxID=2983211 RepID=UPI0023F9E129|nr:choline-binding protein [Lactobacillus sp. ESL0681]WEV41005.1 choline-binding protein [Lactobacillus sp. ESL0681]
MTFFKHNFWGKAILAAGTVVALSGTAVVGAAKGTWTVTTETVSAGGGWSSYGSPNTKKNNSNVASFNGDALPNALGYNVKLINSNASARSGKTGLYKDQTTYGSDNSGKVNYKYYADVRSKAVEPNSSRVKLHFSADRK